MEADGLVAAETVVQATRPNKRVFSLTDAGLEEIRRYCTEPSERLRLKDELLVKITAVDIADHEALLEDIARRRATSLAQLERYESDRLRILRGRNEDTFIRTTRRVGPYLTLLRGIALDEENIAWCDTATRMVAASAARAPARKRTRSA